jgi:hypothetical protein
MEATAVLQSIHGRGREAIATFKALPWPANTCLTAGPAAGRYAKYTPDVLVCFSDGLRVPMEVKKSTTSIAQLRPLSYYTTAVWRVGEGWWIIPPDWIVHLAMDYVGQHCISSFECFNPGKPNSRWDEWKCQDSDVPDRVRRAYLRGESSPMKAVADRIAGEIRDLWVQHRKVVEAARGDAIKALNATDAVAPAR